MWRHIAQSLQGPRHVAEAPPARTVACVRVLGEAAAAAWWPASPMAPVPRKHSDVGSQLACESIVDSADRLYRDARHVSPSLTAEDVLRLVRAARAESATTPRTAMRDIRELRDDAVRGNRVAPNGVLLSDRRRRDRPAPQRASTASCSGRNRASTPTRRTFSPPTSFANQLRVHCDATGIFRYRPVDRRPRAAGLASSTACTPHPPFFEPLFRPCERPTISQA